MDWSKTTARRDKKHFKFWDLVCLVLEDLRYIHEMHVLDLYQTISCQHRKSSETLFSSTFVRLWPSISPPILTFPLAKPRSFNICITIFSVLPDAKVRVILKKITTFIIIKLYSISDDMATQGARALSVIVVKLFSLNISASTTEKKD